jgi:hypothetical protein
MPGPDDGIRSLMNKRVDETIDAEMASLMNTRVQQSIRPQPSSYASNLPAVSHTPNSEWKLHPNKKLAPPVVEDKRHLTRMPDLTPWNRLSALERYQHEERWKPLRGFCGIRDESKDSHVKKTYTKLPGAAHDTQRVWHVDGTSHNNADRALKYIDNMFNTLHLHKVGFVEPKPEKETDEQVVARMWKPATGRHMYNHRERDRPRGLVHPQQARPCTVGLPDTCHADYKTGRGIHTKGNSRRDMESGYVHGAPMADHMNRGYVHGLPQIAPGQRF